MKNTYLFFTAVFLIVVIMISCEKDNTSEPDFISAKLENQNWDGRPEIIFDKETDTLSIRGVGNEQVIVLNLKYTGEGIYNLEKIRAIYYTTVGGDVITNWYNLGKDNSSKVTITEFDTNEKIVKGDFQVSVLNSTDELNFTNGKFKGIFREVTID
ncbi:DUF6252 family protein [Maribacter sedimenticola]|nr:DUF6252 family protein [Maribacter sedimenticola]